MDHQLFHDEEDYFSSAKELQHLASKKECRLAVSAALLLNLACVVLMTVTLAIALGSSIHSLLDVWVLGNLLPLAYTPLFSCYRLSARKFDTSPRPLWRLLHLILLGYTVTWFVLGHFCVFQDADSTDHVKVLGQLMLGLYYALITILCCLLGAAFCIGSLVNK